ncbi:MAG TPA: TMEM175 family protein [Acidimicrobiales bacterium]|nr:TMEM175 family protein [Acidimicrobiales bacterium]
MSKSRVEAFSDGVFAIAITLLVLTVAQPRTYRDLAHELGTQWPSLAAYIVSFAVIGIMWINHHSVFINLEHVDRGLLYINLLLLMTIAFLPYPTGVLGQALAKGQGTRTAAVVYGVVMAINAYAWGGLWLYAARHRRLLRADFPENERATATLLFTFGVVAYTLSVGVAFLNAYAFLALQGAQAVYYAFDPISRRAARQGPAEQEGQDTAGESDPPV